MKLSKKLLSFLVAVLLVVNTGVLAGCGGNDRWGDDITVITALSSYKIADTQWGDDPVSRAITEKTGIALDIEYTVGDVDEKLGGMIAAGDYPDMILSIDNYQLASLVRGNALVDLTQMIDEKGDNIKSTFGNSLNAMKFTDDKIYGVNKEFGTIPTYRDWYIQIQYPVLEALNFPTIETIADLKDALSEFMAMPENKDKGYIPFLAPAGGDSIRHGISNAAMRVAGFQDDGEFYVDPTDLDNIKVEYALTTDEAKEYLKWMNSMYLDGLLDPESFSLDHEGVTEKVANGKVLCVVEPEWALRETEAALKSVDKNMSDKCYAKLPIYLNESVKETSKVCNYDSMGTWKSVITKNCKNVEKAFEFLDYMWSEEAQVMCWWGLEGEHYTKVDGKRELNPEILTQYNTDGDFRTKTGISLYTYFSVGPMVKDSGGEYINPFSTPATIASAYTAKDKEILGVYYNKKRDAEIAAGGTEMAEYDADNVIWSDLWPEAKLSPWGFSWKMSLPRLSGAVVQPSKALTKIKEEINIVKFQDMVLGSAESFDQKFAAYKSLCYSDDLIYGLTGGIRPLEAQYEVAITDLLKEWYGDNWKQITTDMLS